MVRSCVTLLFLASCGLAAPPDGAAIYRESCADCHGEKGMGTDTYDSPLVGDEPLKELTAYIEKTMPEGDAEAIVGEDAAAVARHVYDAFYSPIAQARNRPARVELSRLTVQQHQNALTDLVNGFRWNYDWPAERGLQGKYRSRRRGKDRKDRKEVTAERIDARVEFDYGEKAPDLEGLDDGNFEVWWLGSVIAPRTGEYTFAVESLNGVTLYVNDDQRPVIEAAVQSGDQTRHEATVKLVGGRAYPIKLNFQKRNNERRKEQKASVKLLWTPPHGVEAVIPSHALLPTLAPESYVCTTKFPPDDRSTGYVRGTAVSAAWDSATTYAALETAAYVDEHLKELAHGDDSEKLKAFARDWAERALRRPLTEQERERYIDGQFAAAPNPADAVKRVVIVTLKSPHFLYLEAGRTQMDDFAAAAWLALSLWDSIPDTPLREAAGRGELKTREQLVAQAERMVGDPRTQAKLRDFLHQWLATDRFEDLAKDDEHFAGFDRQLADDLRTSLDLFLDEVVSSPRSDFFQLLLSDDVYMNDRIAGFYGIEAPAGREFAKVPWLPDVRAGVVTHPFVMAGFANRLESSPIHRGVFLTRNVLGRMLKPPPEAVTPLPPTLDGHETTRQRIAKQTEATQCQRCHKIINNLGFALENFDAAGRFRDRQGENAVDATGKYVTQDGSVAQFRGAEELARFLADSPEVHAAFAERLFHAAVKQPVRAFGDDFEDELRGYFAAHEFSIRKLLVHAVTEAVVRYRDRGALPTVASAAAPTPTTTEENR